MNNLVSKNPVLRFKLGKKIVKALRGTLFGRNTLYVYYTGRDGIQRQAFYNPQAKKWMYANRGQNNYLFMPEDYVTWDGYNFKGDFAAVSNLKNKQGILKPLVLPNKNHVKNNTLIPKINFSTPTWNAPKLPQPTSSSENLKNNKLENNKLENKEVNNSNILLSKFTPYTFSNNVYSPSFQLKEEILQKPTQRSLNIPSMILFEQEESYNKLNLKKPKLINNIWLKGFNRHPEVKNVKEMQQKLIDLGLLKDKYGADGKWGKNTEAAYQKLLNILFNPDKLETIVPISNQEKAIISSPIYNYTLDDNPTYRYSTTFLKTGGKLISENPITKFKLRNLK